MQHLHATEEGPTMTWRLRQTASREVICFFGFKEVWQEDDLRVSVATALAASGAQVQHICPGRAVEPPKTFNFGQRFRAIFKSF